MRKRTRIKLDTGNSAEAFCRTNPLDDPAGIAVAERLFLLNDRAGILAQQQQAGRKGVSASVVERTGIRRSIRSDMEKLHQIATAAAAGQPDFAIRLAPPLFNANHQAFLASARATLEAARAAETTLRGFAMPQDLLPRIATDLERYEKAVTGKDDARARQVGARADLDEVANDIVGVVRHLDALYSLKYRDNSELLAAWKSARNVPWPAGSSPTPTTPRPDIAPAA
jgi:hypothetical protein